MKVPGTNSTNQHPAQALSSQGPHQQQTLTTTQATGWSCGKMWRPHVNVASLGRCCMSTLCCGACWVLLVMPASPVQLGNAGQILLSLSLCVLRPTDCVTDYAAESAVLPVLQQQRHSSAATHTTRPPATAGWRISDPLKPCLAAACPRRLPTAPSWPRSLHHPPPHQQPPLHCAAGSAGPQC